MSTPWLTPTDDLRKLLSDGDSDKFNWRKRVLPDSPNGVITTFKTFENRRVTDFTSATGGAYGVFVDGVAATVSVDDPDTGEFQLAAAPSGGQYVEATYNYRWFLDSELDEFLKNASQWLGLGENYVNLADGLQPCALKYAASEGYQKLSLRWALTYSSNFKLEDQPQKDRQDQVQNPYAQLAKEFLKMATTLRDDFYKRQGQPLAPLFRSIAGRVRNVEPNE